MVVRGTGVARCPDCTLAQGRIRQAGKARKATDVEDVLEEIKPLRAKALDKPPKKRGRGATPFNNQPFKPGTRQPAPPPAKVTGELPWWARAKPGEMTTTAKQERERMQNSKEAKQVPGTRIID